MFREPPALACDALLHFARAVLDLVLHSLPGGVFLLLVVLLILVLLLVVLLLVLLLLVLLLLGLLLAQGSVS